MFVAGLLLIPEGTVLKFWGRFYLSVCLVKQQRVFVCL